MSDAKVDSIVTNPTASPTAQTTTARKNGKEAGIKACHLMSKLSPVVVFAKLNKGADPATLKASVEKLKNDLDELIGHLPAMLHAEQVNATIVSIDTSNEGQSLTLTGHGLASRIAGGKAGKLDWESAK